jgi:hypothetical protein
MAKLIMMRYKVRCQALSTPDLFSVLYTHAPRPIIHCSLKLNQVNTQRRCTMTLAQRNAPRQFALPTPCQRLPVAWIHIPKQFGMQHHSRPIPPYLRSLARLHARLCLGLSPVPVSSNTAMAHDNKPTDVFLTPAPPSLRHPLHSAPGRTQRARGSAGRETAGDGHAATDRAQPSA